VFERTVRCIVHCMVEGIAEGIVDRGAVICVVAARPYVSITTPEVFR